MQNETINTNAHSEFADEVLAFPVSKATRLNSFTTFRQRYFQNSFTWTDPRRTIVATNTNMLILPICTIKNKLPGSSRGMAKTELVSNRSEN